MGRISKRIAVDEYEEELLEREEAAKALFKPLNAHQKDFMSDIDHHDVSFGIGPAGTGKTHVAIASAIQHLRTGKIKRIVLTRPIVEAGESLGFLPGTIEEKVNPYFRPIFDILTDLVGTINLQMMINNREIELAPLAYMRGRTLNHSFVVLDEAQNTSPEQMKMFLTRIGYKSKMVITGDGSQNDLPKGKMSGLAHALKVLDNIRSISILEFDKNDVVRSQLAKEIVEAYELDTTNK
jgi:phosphate starvation-inducible PhoH-like protein